MDFYVYYRVRSANAAPLQAAASAMQQALAREHGIRAALKRRPDEEDGRQTWMEVYTAVPPGFAELLEQAAATHRLADLIDGGRHTEIFVDLPPCA